METTIEKTKLEIQRDQYRAKISALQDAIKGRERKIAALENKIAEYEILLQTIEENSTLQKAEQALKNAQ